MRYHWGLAVGHVYTHGHQCPNDGVSWSNQHVCDPEGVPEPAVPSAAEAREPSNMVDVRIDPGSETDGSGSDTDDDYEPTDKDEESDSDSEDDWEDIDEMYGDENSDDDYYDG